MVLLNWSTDYQFTVKSFVNTIENDFKNVTNFKIGQSANW